jgi:phosphoribosylformimino-5-aminoimidazole carboxamide ribotide isomerase
MRVIPVIDLLGGQVVRGIAGRRDEYRPIASQIAADARPATVARALVEHFGFTNVYVADLDAIIHGKPDARSWLEISATGLKLWVDAGVTNAQVGRAMIAPLLHAKVDFELIVGLESLTSLDALLRLAKLALPIVSLDLKGGVLQTPIETLKNAKPIDVSRILREYPIGGLIVLDLADVGMNAGSSTIDLCRQISAECGHSFELISGGGVRGFDDLQALADAGCSGALVASALHDGRLSREVVQRCKQMEKRRGRSLGDVGSQAEPGSQNLRPPTPDSRFWPPLN